MFRNKTALFFTLLAVALFAAGGAKAEKWTSANTEIVPGAVYENNSTESKAYGAVISRDTAFAAPGGTATIVFNDILGGVTTQLSVNSSELRIGNPSHVVGDRLIIRGENPGMRLRSGSLVLDAGNLDRDKAILSFVDTNLIEEHDPIQFYLGGMSANPKIELVNGIINFFEEMPVPEPDASNCVQIKSLTMKIGDKGLFDASNIGHIMLGDGGTSSSKTVVESNGGMAARGLYLAGGATLTEHQTVKVDGRGGTTLTREFFSMMRDSEYFGNVIVDSNAEQDDYSYDMLIFSGALHGDLTILNGKVSFPESVIDGLLTISGGQVTDREVYTGTPPYVARGINMTGGLLSIPEGGLESGGDISIANGASMELGSLTNFAHTISVGSSEDTVGGASLVAGQIDLQPGAMLLADPPWGLAPANVAVENPGNAEDGSTLRGAIGVGMNSHMAIGTRDPAWLPDKIAKATSGVGLSQNGITAALGLYRPLTIAEGAAVVVDGSLNNAGLAQKLAAVPDTANFAAKSALVLNGDDPQMLSGQPAINFQSPNGAAHVQEGAQIFIADAQAGSTYQVVDTSKHPIIYHGPDGSIVERNAAKAWDGDNLKATSEMLQLTYVDGNAADDPATGENPVQPDTSEPGDSGNTDSPSVEPDQGNEGSQPGNPEPGNPNQPTQPGDPAQGENSGDSSGSVPPATEEQPGDNQNTDNSQENSGADVADPEPPTPAEDNAGGDLAEANKPASDDDTKPAVPTQRPGHDSGKIEVTARDAREVYPSLQPSVASVITSLYSQARNDVNSPNAGIRFLSRATDIRFMGTDRSLAASGMESALRMATIGAVSQLTMAANSASHNVAAWRTGMDLSFGQQAVETRGEAVETGHGVALWIMPLYQSANGFGLDAGNYNYDFNGAIGGVALGADYTFAEHFRAGLMFNLGGGYASGSGDLQKTTNDMDFWGIGAYAAWTRGAFGVAADVAYTSTYNKLRQDMLPELRMNDLKSDVTAQALSAGFRLEWRMPFDELDITPHAGLRFSTIRIDSHDINSGGHLASVDDYTRNVWSFPVGVALARDFETASGWHIRPRLDVNVTPATGDLKAKSRARFNGIDQEIYLDADIQDGLTWGGSAGLEFGKGNFSLGVAYNGQFGAHTSSNGVFGIIRYEF